MGKAKRRQNTKIKQKKILNICKNIWKINFEKDMTEEELNIFVKKFRDNAQRCSCPMCGNARRHFGIETIQEKISYLKEEEGIEEYSLKED